MRIFLGLLVPSFLCFAYAEEDYRYSVFRQDTTNACTTDEDSSSLEVIAATVALNHPASGNLEV
jgi:hypothetical protein